MNIITVCGLGMGSSLIMKMTVQDVMKKLDVKANVEHADMGTVNGKNADLIVTTEGFKKNFKDQDNVIFIKNIVDKEEMEEKIAGYLEDKELNS